MPLFQRLRHLLASTFCLGMFPAVYELSGVEFTVI